MDNYEEIVDNYDSPTLVLAGPGAGKTYLLADRVKRLIDKGVDKDTITVLAFGVDASRHMKETLLEPTGHFKINKDQLPHISTMHSLAFRILKEKPRSVRLRKIGLEVQVDENIKRLMYRDAALTLNFSEENSSQSRLCKRDGDCKENPAQNKCKICWKYWEIMSKCNYVDYDDQIIFACRILENNQEILKQYQLQA